MEIFQSEPTGKAEKHHKREKWQDVDSFCKHDTEKRETTAKANTWIYCFR